MVYTGCRDGRRPPGLLQQDPSRLREGVRGERASGFLGRPRPELAALPDLEIGSGLGRITGALSRLAPTVGIDISVEMLARARRRRPAGTRARFVAADMRDLVFGCRFDLIIAPSDPFSHWTAIRERRRALRQIADRLSSEGRFVLEGLYRRGRRIEIPERRVRHSGGVLSIGETWTLTGGDLWQARYRYRDRAAGGTERTIQAGFVARAWNPGEIRSFFNSCGLTIETLWGDFDRRPFRETRRD